MILWLDLAPEGGASTWLQVWSLTQCLFMTSQTVDSEEQFQGKYFPKDVGFSFHLVKSLQCVFGKGGKLKLDRMKLLCWTMRSVVKILSVLDTFRFLCPSVASPGVFIVCCVRLHQTATPAGSPWQKSTVRSSRTNLCPLPPLQAQSRHNVRALNKRPHGDRLLKSNTLLDHFNFQNKSFPLRRSQLFQSN